MLVDRESGRAIVTTAWDSEQALRDSAERVRDMRAKAASTMAASTPEVQDWEIAVLHRARPAGEGACVRVTWMQGDPAKREEQLDAYRSMILPRLDQLPGFCSVSLLIDPVSGRGASAVTYESREALEATREVAMQLREEAARAIGTQFLDIAEFELALAHLRVPETV
jgi:hypothetical protein